MPNVTSGMMNAIKGGRTCPHCNQATGSYAGRYPHMCSGCGESMNVDAKNGEEKEEGSDNDTPEEGEESIVGDIKSLIQQMKNT